MIQHPDCARCGQPLSIKRGDQLYRETCSNCQTISDIEYLSCDLGKKTEFGKGKDSTFGMFKEAVWDVAERIHILAFNVGGFLRDPSGVTRKSEAEGQRATTAVEAVVVFAMIACLTGLFLFIFYLATAIETDEEKRFRRMERSFDAEVSENYSPYSD